MKVARNMVVSISYELRDADGNMIERGQQPIQYLHGGYEGIFPAVERALDGKAVGESCHVRLEPEDAFGDYDADLVRLEPRADFPPNLEVGMQFEGKGENSGETRIYTVTDIAEDKVVVDGNHPLAGRALDFRCQVQELRPASKDEISHGHAHGPGGHHHH